MIRVIKPEGFGNIQLEDAPIPEINSRQVLVRTERTLISRGSELFRRYISEEALPHSIMGYSLTGTGREDRSGCKRVSNWTTGDGRCTPRTICGWRCGFDARTPSPSPR